MPLISRTLSTRRCAPSDKSSSQMPVHAPGFWIVFGDQRTSVEFELKVCFPTNARALVTHRTANFRTRANDGPLSGLQTV